MGAKSTRAEDAVPSTDGRRARLKLAWRQFGVGCQRGITTAASGFRDEHGTGTRLWDNAQTRVASHETARSSRYQALKMQHRNRMIVVSKQETAADALG